MNYSTFQLKSGYLDGSLLPLARFAAADSRSRNSLPLPGMVDWRARPNASPSSGTSWVMTLPDAI
jgi:hypothetical protein